MVKKLIYSITPFTLLDYPDHTACILWFAGCNMRCSYCYNPEIVTGKGKIGFDAVISFLEKRKNLLDGVVFSGGECTMHKDLPYYASEVKRLGMKVKIDTNGSRPHVLEELLQEGLVDYVALDFKSLQEDFESITQSDFFEQFKESLEVLKGYDVPFEIRTTVHSNLINTEKLSKMASFLRDQGYKGKYYLQHFVSEKETIRILPYSKKPNLAFTDYPELEMVWRN
ncbi:pyruvate formate lyase activating enzyme [Belliella buryatensis]|uniref:Pyruvate formate lyase activating enzyme n=1 Tax=Belliella buryatensis TaxID=1500549 RepID=A0A239AQ46_9BACT|nr:anaerobic ribonucleoside-triphosphate reductase activating protein [Belliella buryatensis]SNR97660.1 pyruvate formate lyase activating enzyme [Belliella buryatensis]